MAVKIEEIQGLTQKLEHESADAVLSWALQEFYPRIVLSNSLQVEDMVVLDIAHKINAKVRVFTLDTGRLPQETYEMMDRVRDHYGIPLDVLFPDSAAVEEMVRAKGPNLFYDSVENRHECCGVRKVKPLQKYLSHFDAWVTGLRRDQWASRSNVQKVEIDAANNGIVKVNPIADWSWERLEKYVADHQIPKHKLYSQGYSSIGCLPCTRPTKAGEDPRAGRWWWEDDQKKECGLHVAKT